MNFKKFTEQVLHDFEQETNKPIAAGATLDDFYAYMPMHCYLFMPTRELWPASSINSRFGPIPLVDKNGKPIVDKKGNPKTISTSTWLDQNRPVEQMTWAPGLPALIADRLLADGGFIERPGATVVNLYRPSTIAPGNAARAGPWLDHAHKVFGDEADHLVKWLAQRVQHPEQKINHALVLGGAQGIGKDTLLEPVKRAVGPWNFCEVSPTQMTGRFNSFVKSVILRVNEGRDLGDVNRYGFYDHLKAYTAAPPDVLRCDEKNLREHAVLNCTGVIITTNHKSDFGGAGLRPRGSRHEGRNRQRRSPEQARLNNRPASIRRSSAAPAFSGNPYLGDYLSMMAVGQSFFGILSSPATSAATAIRTRAAGLTHDDSAKAKLDKLDALLAQSSTSVEDAALFAEMLSLPNDSRYPSLDALTAEQRRQKTLEALTSQMATLARQNPVLMIFEDAHWADPTSLEVFSRCVDQIIQAGQCPRL
jgi:hypothetical protein